MKKILLLLLIFPIIFSSCSSGSKAFERGAYDQAIFKSINRIRKKSTNKKALQTLKDAYPLALKWHNNNIVNAKKTNNLFKWENVVNEYKALNKLHDQIMQCPGCLNVIEPKNYNYELEQAEKLAAEIRYKEGAIHLIKGEQGNKNEARLAYQDFFKCNQIIPGYQDVQMKMEDARFYSTTRVLVKDIPMHSANFKLTSDFFANKINEYVHGMANNRFVEFYTEPEIQKLSAVKIDQVLYMQFDDFVVGEATTIINTEQLVRKDVVVGQVEVKEDQEVKNEDGTTSIKKVKVLKDVYGDVSAKLKTTTLDIESGGLLDFKIIDAYTNRVLTQEKFPGTFVWTTMWGNFNGDERALSKEQLDVTKTEPVMPQYYPTPQELFIEFTVPIFDQISAKINSFYANY